MRTPCSAPAGKISKIPPRTEYIPAPSHISALIYPARCAMSARVPIGISSPGFTVKQSSESCSGGTVRDAAAASEHTATRAFPLCSAKSTPSLLCSNSCDALMSLKLKSLSGKCSDAIPQARRQSHISFASFSSGVMTSTGNSVSAQRAAIYACSAPSHMPVTAAGSPFEYLTELSSERTSSLYSFCARILSRTVFKSTSSTS